jgi:hypothetical protein
VRVELALGPVGESGWQRSASDLLILDESFAALDRENLQLAMECGLRDASSVLVIPGWLAKPR